MVDPGMEYVVGSMRICEVHEGILQETVDGNTLTARLTVSEMHGYTYFVFEWSWTENIVGWGM